MNPEPPPAMPTDTATLPAEVPLQLGHILVPLDFSAHGMKALAYARSLARRLDAHLFLVHVVEPLVYPSDLGYTPVITDDLAADLQREGQNRLDDVVRQLNEAGLNARGVLRSGRPYLEITEAAAELRADLIVLTTHGYTGLKHVLLGSTAERVVRHARCPVLVVRDPEPVATPEPPPPPAIPAT